MRPLRAYLGVLLFAASVSVFLSPFFFDALSACRQTSELSGYEAEEAETDPALREQMRREAEAYNESVYREQQEKLFVYRGEEAGDSRYEAALRTGGGGIMGSLFVPKIGVHLPIVHGTRAEDLEYRCGHMYGSSLPLGGINTHAVLAGHTGLPTAALFTNLTELEAGDQFTIRTLGETHVYQVADVFVVYPDEEAQYLQILPGEDLVTLYTCTPYGVNDRRLLVRGRRVFPDAGAGGAESAGMEVRNRAVLPAVRALAGGAAGPAVLLLGAIAMRRKQVKGGHG